MNLLTNQKPPETYKFKFGSFWKWRLVRKKGGVNTPQYSERVVSYNCLVRRRMPYAKYLFIKLLSLCVSIILTFAMSPQILFPQPYLPRVNKGYLPYP